MKMSNGIGPTVFVLSLSLDFLDVVAVGIEVSGKWNLT